MPRIDVVDDHHLNRVLISTFLKQEGHDVQTHSSGEEFLEFYKKENHITPELVLLDINMDPGISGVQVLELALRDSTFSATLFVSCSAYLGLGDDNWLFNIGFDGHLGVPINPLQLQSTIDSLINQKEECLTKRYQETENQKRRS